MTRLETTPVPESNDDKIKRVRRLIDQQFSDEPVLGKNFMGTSIEPTEVVVYLATAIPKGEEQYYPQEIEGVPLKYYIAGEIVAFN